MKRAAIAIAAFAGALVLIANRPAAAEVLDAVYRGTMVCDKLPFTESRMRDAIEVTISGGMVRYSHVVRLRGEAEAVPERGFGTLNGQNISLQGFWSGGARQYQATYSGTFVRRSAKLKGRQTWNDAGRIITRNCSGAIKRPFKAFLPRKKNAR